MQALTALADPTRFRIVELLAANGALSSGHLSRQFAISPPAVSQHLKVLREAKLVHVEARAQQRIYTLNPHGLGEIERWAETMKLLSEARFSALDALLAKERTKTTKPRSKK